MDSIRRLTCAWSAWWMPPVPCSGSAGPHPSISSTSSYPEPHLVKDCEINLRVGGRFNTVFEGDGTERKNEGVYLEIDLGRKLVFTDGYSEGWKPSADPFMTAIILFEDAGEGSTRYTAIARHRSPEPVKAMRIWAFSTAGARLSTSLPIMPGASGADTIVSPPIRERNAHVTVWNSTAGQGSGRLLSVYREEVRPSHRRMEGTDPCPARQEAHGAGYVAEGAHGLGHGHANALVAHTLAEDR
jgi:hypothetical protein